MPPQRKLTQHLLYAWLHLHAWGHPQPPSGLHKHLRLPALLCLQLLVNLVCLPLSSQNLRQHISFLPSHPSYSIAKFCLFLYLLQKNRASLSMETALSPSPDQSPEGTSKIISAAHYEK